MALMISSVRWCVEVMVNQLDVVDRIQQEAEASTILREKGAAGPAVAGLGADGTGVEIWPR
jgi:hypothetical protein